MAVSSRPRSRPLRMLAALLLAAAVVLLGQLVGTRPAWAAADQIDSFAIDYNVQASGVVKVKETITWRFGSDSGRHGIQRDLVTREKYDDTEDAVYAISNVEVSSPDGVSTSVSQSTSDAQQGRQEFLNLRIGDANQTISEPTA